MRQTTAVIDLGTNTFNLLIMQVTNNVPHILHTTKQAVQLGEHTIGSNIINAAAQQRAINALQHFVTICNEYKVTTINAFATSAVRNASNCNEFCTAVKQYTNIIIQVIDGLREAELIYNGVRHAVTIPTTHNTLIMDIGGGSTEFIICNHAHIIFKQSYNIGIARLLAKFNPSDVITEKDKTTITNYLTAELSTLTVAIQLHRPTLLVGSSGSFDTFADVLLLQNNLPILTSQHTSYEFDLPQLFQLFETIYVSTFEQRLAMPGVIPLRAQMLVLAALCTQYIITQYNINQLWLSTYALKEGVMYEGL